MTDAYAPTEPGSDALVEMLRRRLQVAIEAELAKIPVYLYAAYSSSLAPPEPLSNDADTADYTPVGIFAARVGARLLAVVNEKLVQATLLGRILYAVGGELNFFRRTPPMFPVRLLGLDAHAFVEFDLRSVGYEQLQRFAEVELAAGSDDGHYAQIRRILGSSHFHDAHFRVNRDAPEQPPAFAELAAALHGAFLAAPEGKRGLTELPRIETKAAALDTLELVCARGQNPLSSRSHYQMFLGLLAELDGFEADARLRAWPARPAPPSRAYTPAELAKVTSNFPVNPNGRLYPPELWPIVDLCGELLQYALLIAEANLLVPARDGRRYINPALFSAIFSLIDELTVVLRRHTEVDGTCLAPTFEYLERGSKREAYKNLCSLAAQVGAQHSELAPTVARILATDEQVRLPDLSACF